MAAGGKTLFVSAALVAVTTVGGSQRQLRFGDVITDDVSKESVALLKDLGYVSEKSPLDNASDDN